MSWNSRRRAEGNLAPGFGTGAFVQKDLKAGDDQLQVCRLRQLLLQPGPLGFAQHIPIGFRCIAVVSHVEQDELYRFVADGKLFGVVDTRLLGGDLVFQPPKGAE